MSRRLLAVSVASALALGGPSASVRADSAPPPTATSLDVLAGHHWELRTITQQGKRWVAPQNPGFWLTFGPSGWSGEDGCNDTSGPATYTASAVQLARTAATTFVCHGDDSTHMVTAFALLLQTPAAVSLSEGVLSLSLPSETFTFHDTSAPPSPESLEGKLVGWYWRIQSTTLNGTRTVTPKNSRAAINFSDQDFDASDDCGNDYTGDSPVTYTDVSMTTPDVMVSAVGCPDTPLRAAYAKVFTRGTIRVAVTGTTLTLSRAGATLVYTRGPAAAYAGNFLAGAPPKPLTAARVALSVAGPTWQLTQLDRGSDYWGVPRSYGTLVSFGRTSVTISYGCVTWTGPITYTAFGITASARKSTASCAQATADRKVDAAVTLLLADTFTASRGGGSFLTLAGGGVSLALASVLPTHAHLVIAPQYLKPLMVGRPWTVTVIGHGRAGSLVPTSLRATVTFSGTAFVAKAGCARLTGKVTYTRQGASFVPLHRTTCATGGPAKAVEAAYAKVLRALPRFSFGYGQNQVTFTEAGTTLVLGRYGP